MSKESKDGVWKFYSVEKESMSTKFTGRKCPRCGTNMGLHKQGRTRWYCGQCHYTEYV